MPDSWGCGKGRAEGVRGVDVDDVCCLVCLVTTGQNERFLAPQRLQRCTLYTVHHTKYFVQEYSTWYGVQGASYHGLPGSPPASQQYSPTANCLSAFASVCTPNQVKSRARSALFAARTASKETLPPSCSRLLAVLAVPCRAASVAL